MSSVSSRHNRSGPAHRCDQPGIRTDLRKLFPDILPGLARCDVHILDDRSRLLDLHRVWPRLGRLPRQCDGLFSLSCIAEHDGAHQVEPDTHASLEKEIAFIFRCCRLGRFDIGKRGIHPADFEIGGCAGAKQMGTAQGLLGAQLVACQSAVALSDIPA